MMGGKSLKNWNYGQRSSIRVVIGPTCDLSFSSFVVANQHNRMKITIFLLAVVALGHVKSEPYTTKYDNVDVDQILRNDRLLNNYVKCLLEEGSCTTDGKELKAALPDALATGCRECSEKQKAGSEKVIRYLVNERPQIWSKLAVKYDPHDEYRKKFQGEAASHGIRV